MEAWKKRMLDMIATVDSGRINERSWIKHGPLKAYVRVSTRLINGEIKGTVEVASVEVIPDERGKGVFSSWLREVEDMAKQHKRAVYIESVLNKGLGGYFVNSGYLPMGTGHENSYYKFLA